MRTAPVGMTPRPRCLPRRARWRTRRCTRFVARASPAPPATWSTSLAGAPGSSSAPQNHGSLLTTLWSGARSVFAAPGAARCSMTELQVGFVRGRQPMDVTELPLEGFRKGHKWSRPVCIASLDVEKAFGQPDAWVVERSMLAHRSPEWAIAAVLREMVGRQGWAMVAGAARAYHDREGSASGRTGNPTHVVVCGQREQDRPEQNSSKNGRRRARWSSALILISGRPSGTLTIAPRWSVCNLLVQVEAEYGCPLGDSTPWYQGRHQWQCGGGHRCSRARRHGGVAQAPGPVVLLQNSRRPTGSPGLTPRPERPLRGWGVDLLAPRCGGGSVAVVGRAVSYHAPSRRRSGNAVARVVPGRHPRG